MREFNLLTDFVGKPYVDLYLSLKSFIPRDLNPKIKHKLLYAYLDIFKRKPFLHDKIEFEIAFTC